MEFHEKLQKLRTAAQLTQEELGEKLFVSRTAVSKWESGRGYPSIESLKAIAAFFHVSVDELIGSDEILSLAEQERKQSEKKWLFLVCGILDCLVGLLFFLPIFGQAGASGAVAVNLFQLGVSSWLKTVFIGVIALSVCNGFCALVICSFDKPVWNKHRLVTGMVLTALATVLFIVCKQPYAAVLLFVFLVIKGILVLRNK